MISRRNRIRVGLLAIFLSMSLPASAISCLIFPLSCLKPSKKYGEEVEAKVLGISSVHTHAYVTTITPYGSNTAPNPLENTREFFVSFQVGQTRYIAYKEDTVIQMAGLLGGYNPKRDEWVGKTVKMRFMDETDFGLFKAPVAVFKTPKGKDWQLVVISIVGADGVDECPPFFGFKGNMGHCGLQKDIDRPKREAEIAAKLEAQGKRPLWDTLDLESAQKIAAARERPGGSGDASTAAAPATPAIAAEPVAATTAAPAATAEPAAAATPVPAAEPAAAPAPAIAPSPAATPAAPAAPSTASNTPGAA